MLVALLVLCLFQKLRTLRTRCRFRPDPAITANSLASTPSPTCNGDDSGYAGSETFSDEFSKEDDPHYDSSVDEDVDDENYDLHRAIRLCQEAATPRRVPANPYSKEFEVYTSFLSETQKKARYRGVGGGTLGAQ